MALRAAVVSLACLLALAASAQDGPRRPVTFVVPSAAGSSLDQAARTLAGVLAARWKQAVVIDNRPGAGTMLATNAVAKAAPDGHTVGWVIATHATNPTLRTNLPYDTLKDLSGVTLVYQLRPVIIASADLPFATIGEFVEFARRHPGQFYSSTGVGSGPHLLAELFKRKHGLDLQHVPHKSGGAAQLDVMGGRVSIMFDTLPSALPLIQQGKVKVLAVIGDAAVPGHPEFFLMRDLLPEGTIVGWNGLVVPSATPPAIVRRLHADVTEAMGSDVMQALFARLGLRPLASTPEGFDAFIRDDIKRWEKVIRDAGIQLE